MVRLSIPLALVLIGLSQAAAAPAPPSLVPPNAPKSAFINEQGHGKDPFFPDSTRIIPLAPVDPTPAQQDIPGFVTLKGISISQGRKLAIINNYTVAEGEEFQLRSGTQVTKLKCIEIKDRTVVVQVNGVTKELPLRAGLN